MKKILTLAVIVLASGIMLSACTLSKKTTAPEDTGQTDQELQKEYQEETNPDLTDDLMELETEVNK